MDSSFGGNDGRFRYKFASSADEGVIRLGNRVRIQSPWALMGRVKVWLFFLCRLTRRTA